MPKAFIVSCEVEVIVVAENGEKARASGCRAVQESIGELHSMDLDIREAMELPLGWQGNDYVYGVKDMRAKEALMLNESYRRKLEEMKLAKMGQRKLFNKENTKSNLS